MLPNRLCLGIISNKLFLCNMLIYIRFYLFVSFIATILPSTLQAISVRNDSNCIIAVFSLNGSNHLHECTLAPNETCEVAHNDFHKLLAIDPNSLSNPKFKTELIADTDDNSQLIIIKNANCEEVYACNQTCPFSYTEDYSNELNGKTQSGNFEAYHSINSKHVIGSDGNVSYQAGHQVKLLSLFELSLGSELEVVIKQCDNLVLDKDLTDQLIDLGNIPLDLGFENKERNIWDLQVFEDRLFLGFGNTTTNPGPFPLFAWDNALDSFINYGIIQGEAIEKFRINNDSLYIPNSDPKGDTRKYNYVINTQLNEVSLDYRLAHVRDMIPFNNKLYLLGNTRCPGTFSMDCSGLLELNGSSYNTNLLTSELLQADPYTNARWNWFFGGWTYGEKLIIPNAMFNEIDAGGLIIENAQFFTITENEITWSANAEESEKFIHQHFFPAEDFTNSLEDSIKFNTILRPQTSLEIENKLLYTLRSYAITTGFDNLYRKEYNNSRGMYLKESLYDFAAPVVFPEPNAVGEDILVIDERVYALANKKQSNGRFKVFVYSTDSPTKHASCWQEEFNFQSQNIARSFEYLGNDFYFGLGMNEGDDVESAGKLYKLNWVNQRKG